MLFYTMLQQLYFRSSVWCGHHGEKICFPLIVWVWNRPHVSIGGATSSASFRKFPVAGNITCLALTQVSHICLAISLPFVIRKLIALIKCKLSLGLACAILLCHNFAAWFFAALIVRRTLILGTEYLTSSYPVFIWDTESPSEASFWFFRWSCCFNTCFAMCATD